MCSFSAHSLGPMYITNTSHYNGYLFLRLMQKLRAWSPWRPSDPHSPREGSKIIYKGLSERKEGNAIWGHCVMRSMSYLNAQLCKVYAMNMPLYFQTCVQ